MPHISFCILFLMKNVGITSGDCWSLSTGLWPLCREYQVAALKSQSRDRLCWQQPVGGHQQTPRTQDSAPAPPPDNFILDCYAPRHCWWNLNMRNIRKDSRMLRRKTKFPSFCLPSEQFADLPYFPFYSGTRQLFPPPPLPALTCNLNRYDELIC